MSSRDGRMTERKIAPRRVVQAERILYFAGEPARIIRPDTLRGGNVSVPIWLRRTLFYRLADAQKRIYSPNCISASLRSSAIPLWPCFSDWEIPFS